jgi:hypothetical protein
MDDQRWEPGMPVLDRQAVRDAGAGGASGRPGLPGVAGGEATPRSVPEIVPTPLQRHFVLLSAPALVAGAIGITALEAGAGFGSWLVKLCTIVAAPLLLLTTVDATVRIWRSAWAWLPVNRGRGLFRFAWVIVSLVFLSIIVGATLVVLAG